MADDADMRNELSDMQQRADQLADEVRTTRTHTHTHTCSCILTSSQRQKTHRNDILKLFNVTDKH